MKIVISKTIGYCHGVSATIANAKACIARAASENVNSYSIGELIHNEHVVEYFRNKGLQVIHKPEDGKPGIALVRAHGIPDSLRIAFEHSGYTLIDSTCGNINVTIAAMKEAYSQGRKIIVIGIKDHAETKTLLGVQCFSQNIADYEINGLDSLSGLYSSLSRFEPITVVTQATFPQNLYFEICNQIKSHYADIKFGNRLCTACIMRKNNAKQLAQTCDAVLVVGSKTSTNTQDIVRFVSESGGLAYSISNESDLSEEFKKEISKFDKIGICSGTSTPGYVIGKVVKALESIEG